MSDFAYRIDVGERSVDLVLAGELGLEVADLLTTAGAEATRMSTAPLVVVDLRDVTFIDSTGIGALVSIRGAALAAGKELRLREVPPRITRLLGITGLIDVFPLDDLADRAG
jgi:anti-sigma B factor antagonist